MGPSDADDDGLRENSREDITMDEFEDEEINLDSIPSWVDEGLDQLTQMDNVPQPQDAPDASALFSEGDGSLAEVTQQRDSYLEALRQLQADFENYKKRVNRDNQEFAEMKAVKLMEELLPILDHYQLALSSIKDDDEDAVVLRKGLELVYADLYSVLERQGLERIEAEGAIFDPELHEAVAHEHIGKHATEVVVEVLRVGYKVRGRVVRPAMVKVAQ